ncbi:hypothetical protein [Cellulomonas timonensis]|uniref:hypothetical protein n=1 Tax=Cellulomonas timonensis TaxID=1689271 RepID=UPI00082E19B7|nr:hypothetical protein [Cellulomonas timonensis]
MSRRRLLYAVAVIGALLIAGLSTASAATLPLSGIRLSTLTVAERCAPELPVESGPTTGGTATSVTIRQVPADCGGKSVRLRLLGASGPLAPADAVATLPAAGATATIPVAAFTPSAVRGVALTVDGWGVTPAWSAPTPTPVPGIACTVPGNPAATCDVKVTSSHEWGSGASRTYLRRFEVSTTSTKPVTWQLTLNLSDTTLFPFVAAGLSDQQGGLVKVSASACSDVPRLVTVKGTESWGSYHTVVAGEARSLEVQGFASAGGNLLSCS